MVFADRFHTLLDQQPPLDMSGMDGWLLPDEERGLAVFGQIAPGPILEVGPWTGRSTLCICAGITDPKPFTVCELNPTLANFPIQPDGRYGFVDPPGSPDLLGGAIAPRYFDTEFRPVLESAGGVVGRLEANLTAHGVRGMVDEIVTGDFRQVLTGRWGGIFCDAVHDVEEIRRNAPTLVKLLASGGVLACHDTTAENRVELDRWFTFTDTVQVDSLLVGAVA